MSLSLYASASYSALVCVPVYLYDLSAEYPFLRTPSAASELVSIGRG